MTQARLSRIESGAAIPTAADITVLLDIYQVHGEQRRGLERIADGARAEIKDERLVVQRGRTAAMQARWLRIIDDAHLVRAYHPAMVIGSLQVPAYAGVVLDLDSEAMHERAQQQDLLTSRPRQQHIFVQTEGALRTTVGSAAVMAEQIERLIEVSRLPNVRLGVMPALRPMAFTCGTAFHLFEGDRFAAAVVGLEIAAATLAEPKDVAHFTALFERLAAHAVYDDDARELLIRIADGHRI